MVWKRSEIFKLYLHLFFKVQFHKYEEIECMVFENEKKGEKKAVNCVYNRMSQKADMHTVCVCVCVCLCLCVS